MGYKTIRTIENKLYGAYRRTGKLCIKYASNNPRPSSYPYISGDTFRHFANHIYDGGQNFTIQNVRENDIIFVETQAVLLFFKQVHPDIFVKYKLITHNSDHAVDSNLVEYIDDNINIWFAQNNSCLHPKIIPIPIGLENLHHYNHGVVGRFNKLRQKLSETRKRSRILFGFSIGTNCTEREVAHRIFNAYPFADEIETRLHNKRYLNTLISYQFVAAPPGNGLDTHRTWEAMYLGVVPIVKNSVAMSFFEQLGLPIWVVDDWAELATVDEQALNKKYEELKNRFNSPALFMDYWRSSLNKTLL